MPVLASERTDYLANLTAQMQFYHRGSGRWRWNGPQIPLAKPASKSVWVDDDGRIWVEVSTAAQVNDAIESRWVESPAGEPDGTWARRRWREPLMYDIVEASGRDLGRVELPGTDNILLQAARGSNLVVSVASEWGWITVRRYRISWK